VQHYRKVGNFWLQSSSESDSDVRIFGRAHLRIDDLDYKLAGGHTEDEASLIRPAPVE
jgi:hypothetical protein